MRPGEISQLKQTLSQEAAEAAERPESAVWLEPEQWSAYMGKQVHGELSAAFSNEELLSILREAADRLGRNPSKKEVFCVYRVFLIERFGNWPRALIAAGLKAPRKERRSANRHRNFGQLGHNEGQKQTKNSQKNGPTKQMVCLRGGAE